ncbi:MAG: TIGR04255 family protein [Rhodomicrobium sp.]
MGQKLSKPPIFFSLIQARFNPLFALESYGAQIQNRLRQEGFPDASKNPFQVINLSLISGAPVQGPVPVAQSIRYIFGNRERTSGFLMDEAALTFQTTAYDTFDVFLEQFLVGLRTVNEVAQLDFVERVGVRYLNAIAPDEGEELSKYFSPCLLGLTEKLEGRLAHTFSETHVKSDSAHMLVRAVIRDGEIGFPPDLAPGTLEVAQRFRDIKGKHGILDIDGWREAREGFDLKQVELRLRNIHDDGVEKAFHAAVTKEALKAWA